MSLLKLPFSRFLVLCVVISTLFFTQTLTVISFLSVGAIFTVIESILHYKKFVTRTGNHFIDFGWIVAFVLASEVVLVLFVLS